MPTKSNIKKVPVLNEKVVVIHTCTQKQSIARLCENANKLSIIITGNGEPEKGLCRQVALIGERQGETKEKLVAIHDSLHEYHEEIQEAKKIALTTESALNQYKASIEGEAKGKERVKASAATRISLWIAAIAVVVSLMLGLMSITKDRRDDREFNSLVNAIKSMQIPDTTNKKGG
jgi:hypothetical protein